MIKTHKPRGHLWTCPSLFQQSKEIRNVHYDDCTPAPVRNLYPDSDDELPLVEQAAKRRRIEKLADDFLNGQPLLISCARPHPVALKATVEGNERHRTGHKYSLPAREEAINDFVGVRDGRAGVCRPAEVSHLGAKPQQRSAKTVKPTAKQAVTEDNASSACKQVRQMQAARVCAEPSTAAVKQATALRDRRLQSTALEVAESSAQFHLGSPGNSDNIRDGKKPSSEWLMRRKTTLLELSAEESYDELGLYSLNTPFRPTQAPEKLPSATKAASKMNTLLISTDSFSDPLIEAIGISRIRVSGKQSPGSYQEHWECYDNAGSPESVDHSLQDAAPFTSQMGQACSTAREHTEAELTDVGKTPSPALDQQPSKSRKAKPAMYSTMKQLVVTEHVSRRRSAPSRSQAIVSEDNKIHEKRRATTKSYATADGNDTPFMFRKRPTRQRHCGSTSRNEVTEKSTLRRPVKFLSSEEDMKGKDAIGTTEHFATPNCHVSFATGSLAPKVNLALADEHLNTILPEDSTAVKRSSAIKHAIREEFMAAHPDVEITRITDEPASSQLEGLDAARRLSLDAIAAGGKYGTTSDEQQITMQLTGTLPANITSEIEAAEAKEQESLQIQWPGTQAMLAQAHRDFFDSPVKNTKIVGPDTPGNHYAPPSSAPPTVHREPLSQLWQEPAPLPSTQALLNQWSPWSTVKKAQARYTKETEPSPLAASITSLRKGGTSFPNFTEEGDRPRSRLSFPTSFLDSPASSSRLSLSVTKLVSQQHHAQTLTVGKETPKSILRRSQGPVRSLLGSGQVAAKSDLDDTNVGDASAGSQHAQYLFGEDSNVSDTIAELAADVLETDGMNSL
ncbi:hypothetical protein LTR62_005869 [Meristemomyces frigidus]|uniref:Uncharacterized protein n=1 Tax=Meristemomyces frigidus TaxID=1508187 RepID=A0AAN7TMU1_9PEZI|nr:hypothetical protein LTR62_005869 [Meristemomyces frigidus]